MYTLETLAKVARITAAGTADLYPKEKLINDLKELPEEVQGKVLSAIIAAKQTLAVKEVLENENSEEFFETIKNLIKNC